MLNLPFKSCRIVVKLGTGILTSGIGEIHTGRIREICRQISLLQQQDLQIIVVSSGAVGLGMGKLGLKERPSDLASLQACAAVGQSILIQTWQQHFEPYQQTVAQLLLTRDDLESRTRHLAARNTLEKLLDEGIIPIINENDSVSVQEIKFGDNDVLSAMVGSFIRADYLLILSTAPGLLNTAGDGELIPIVEKMTPEIRNLAKGTTSETAVGGMITKLEAAEIANRSGCGVFIADGSDEDVILQIFAGKNPGTFFVPSGEPLESRKRWLAFFQQPNGTVTIDAGACEALLNEGRSLLAKGITSIDGKFQTDEVINIAGPNSEIIARGVSPFSSSQIAQHIESENSKIRALFPDRRRIEVI